MPEHARALVSTGHGLLEGPIWSPVDGLLVSDGDHGGVWSLGDRGLDVLRIPHRRGIGGMALHETGDLIVSGRNVAAKSLREPESAGRVLLDNDPSRQVLAFNDLTTDAAGRLYVGSVSFRSMHDLPPDPPALGRLYRIDLDGAAQVVATDVQLTNGLGFSPDGRRLYHSDSLRRVVKVYDVDPADGALGPPRAAIRCEEGLPDGLALSADGDVWVAQADAGLVVRYSPDGRPRERFAFDEPMVTSLCFGGEDLRDLYVVTGSRGSSRGGCVYRLAVEVPGAPRAPCRVRLPAE